MLTTAYWTASYTAPLHNTASQDQLPMPASLRSLCFLLFITASFNRPDAQAQEPSSAAAKAAAVAPYLDEQTLAVARLDLRQLDAAQAVKTLGRIAPPGDAEFPKQLARLEQNAAQLLQALKAAGISELYAIFSLTDLPKEPFFLIAPTGKGADPQNVAPQLKNILGFEQADPRPGAVLLGKAAIIERLKSQAPAARPDFLRGFEQAGDAALQVVICPSDDARRVIREMLPRLPEEVGGGSGKMLTDGFQWASISLQAPPRLSLSIVIHSRDADAAIALRGMIVSALQLLTSNEHIRRGWPEIDQLARLLTPRASGQQLLVTVPAESGEMDQLLRLVIDPLQAARTAAGRAQSMNNLKQLGLALHNYHDVHKRFPPQSIRGKDGRQLLSWRVALLPFLDADSLYKQFKLDEPWDSEHNKALIAKMPPTFASPALGDERRAKGLTSYLAPLSHQPPAFVTTADFGAKSRRPAKQEMAEMIFDVAEGTRMQQITDGTSNTAVVVEAHPASAVIWTKPDDLVISTDDPFRGLRDQPNAFAALFADGSVRMVSYNVDPKTLLHLFQMNDGHPLGELP